MVRSKEEQEIEKSIDEFKMKHIYPKLPLEKRQRIDFYLAQGKSVSSAFDLVGVKGTTFIR